MLVEAVEKTVVVCERLEAMHIRSTNRTSKRMLPRLETRKIP